MRASAKIIFLSLILLTTIKYSQDFYSTNNVNEIDIIFEEENWDGILDEYWRKGNEDRLKCIVKINGISFSNVGVRYKGFSSYKRTFQKKPINIKLDYINDQSYQGVETIKLSNGFRDPTFIREILAYEIFRKYMPASKANFVNLTINGIYKGVYISTETVDKNFIKKNFRENAGAFFKGDPERINSTFIGKSDFKFLGHDSTLYYNSYEIKSDKGWSELIDFFYILNNDIENIENHFNIDQLLWFFVINNALVNLDSPINVFRNFYLYKDATNRFNIIPWDLNMAFGAYKSIAGFSGRVEPNTLQTLDYLHNLENTDFPLINKILSIPRFKMIYLAHLKTVLEENFTNNWYLERARQLQDIISASVYEDRIKFYSDQDFRDNIDYTIGNESIFTIGIKDLMNQRVEYLNSQIEYHFYKPKIVGVDYSPLRVSPGENLILSVSSFNTDKVTFAYRKSYFESYEMLEMNHVSSTMNNNIKKYEISIFVEPGEIQYFVTGENNSSISFYPEEAEYKFAVLPVSGDLVINEILSSNNKTISDEAGEYDDCIELYNNSEFTISLNNYYLSDKFDNLTKWKLPDLEIEADEYIIIWADEDSEQGMLHSNFKLSAEGEDLFLSNSDLILIDLVSYGKQNTDISYGRIPNGIGQFVPLLPSISKVNSSPLNKNNNKNNINFQLDQNYPNPFNSNTVISYKILEDSKINLSVYNILGQKVAQLEDGFKASGNYNIPFGSDELSSGIYFYRLDAGNFSQTRKMLLIK